MIARAAAGRALTAADVEPIARGQIAEEDAAFDRAVDARRAWVVRDTDLVSTVVYARDYYGACPAWVEDAAARRRADLYLLCDADLPWTADAARDAGSDRGRVLDGFVDVLRAYGCTWSWVRGRGRGRHDRALAAIRAALPDAAVRSAAAP